MATSFKAEEIASLPTDRSLNSTILFAPGVFATGPSTNSQDSSTQAITIAGAMSFENLFLVNGVVLNENLRGQAVPLFIEDAVQETTVTSGAVSAEFGRFSGGVVSAVTKSGGNRFSGSFRTTFTNDDWRELTPHPNDVKVDDVVPTYEFTGGGPIARDHLWFFGAGRVVDRVEGRQTTTTNVPYAFSEEERRYEGKLTFSPTANHTDPRQLHLPQPRPGQRLVVHDPRPAQPLRPLAAGRPALGELHRRAVAELLHRGHLLEPQPQVRRQRRDDDRHRRRHAGDRPGAQLALLVADVLRRLRPRRGAQQRELRRQGHLLRLDQGHRLAQPGVRLRHVQRHPPGGEPPVGQRLPHPRHDLDHPRRRRLSELGARRRPRSSGTRSMRPALAPRSGPTRCSSTISGGSAIT